MPEPSPADVAVEIDAIRAWSTLERLRQRVDPREAPVAVIAHTEGAAASRLLKGLDVSSFETPEGQTFSCGWVPRARAMRALRSVEPLEAHRLERSAPTDVRVWTLVHATSTCRVAEYGRGGPVTRAAENAILGGSLASRGCCNPRCDDGSEDHDWDDREIRDEQGNAVDDATCVRCGMPYDLYVTWSAWDF